MRIQRQHAAGKRASRREQCRDGNGLNDRAWFPKHHAVRLLPNLLLLLLCVAVQSTGAAVAIAPSVVPANAYPLHIVICREDVDTAALLEEFHITLKSPKHHFRALKGFAALLDAATIERLKDDPRVLCVEADGPMAASGQISTFFALRRIGIPRFPIAHIYGTNEPLDVDVAILDSGIDSHEDLEIYNNEFYAFGDDASDALAASGGHGTLVAGIVAMKDNGLGFVGVASGVRIWNVKVLGPPPNNAWSNMLSGMDYVLQNASQISIANVSISNPYTSAPVHSIRLALGRLVSAGVVVVVSAGNASEDLAGPDGIYGTGDDAVPASLPDAMAVSAMDATPTLVDPFPPTDQLWSGSNFSRIPRNIADGQTNHVFSPGGAIDVAAPGVNIVTTGRRTVGQSISTNYSIGTGTSFAAPHVTGLVALYIAANGRATNAAGVYRIRQAIVDNAQPQSQWRPNGLPFDAVTNNTGDPDTNPEPLAIASENWVPRPVLTQTIAAPGILRLNFTTVPGYDYTVQSANDLAPPVTWANLATVPGGSNLAPASVTDRSAANQSFYRLSRTPSP